MLSSHCPLLSAHSLANDLLRQAWGYDATLLSVMIFRCISIVCQKRSKKEGIIELKRVRSIRSMHLK